MTEIQLNRIKKIAHALDSNLDCCDVSHIRREDGKAADVMVIVNKAGTPAHESKPVGKYQITPQGTISSYGEWK